MFVTIRLLNEPSNIDNFRALRRGGAWVVDLTKISEKLGVRKRIVKYQTPIIEGAKYFINVTERGGWLLNKGASARIVCGLSGKKLAPYHLQPFAYTAEGGDKAFFAVPFSVVTVEINDRIEIWKHQVKIENESRVTLVSRRIWVGRLNSSLPENFGQF